MNIAQYRTPCGLTWGEILTTEERGLDFARASGLPDVYAYLNAAGAAPLHELRQTCLHHGWHWPLSQTQMMAPIRPGTLFGVGCNFKSTAPAKAAPILFLKAVASIIGPGQDIVLPTSAEAAYAEVELAVVMGPAATIFGYAIVNDVTLRGIDSQDIWFYRKSRATFAPLGPWIVTRDDIANPTHLAMELIVNDRIVLRGNTAEMLFSPDVIIAGLSDLLALMPGDVIMMGCPGMPDKLQPDDRVKLAVEGLGALENRVVRKPL
ncbi:MAG: fumarylacetoacetate hydrolase family protein [Verrucomicrobia bacterium]|nr:fumarylacetoacetate hydrolase family protein [Verrucomicrobiota bacterium]